MMNLLKQDIELLNQKGITEEMLRSQLSFFRKESLQWYWLLQQLQMMGLWYLLISKKKDAFLGLK